MVAAQEAAATQASEPGATTDDADDLGGLGDLLGRFATTMGPVLLGMQFGSAAGHLAQRALGRYALPIPWPGSDELFVVPENIDAFAADWSLPTEQAQLWVCVHELTAHAVLSRPHVADRLRELLEAAADDAVAAQQGLADRLGGEAGDPMALQHLLSDPESLLADLLTPGQQRTSTQLIAVTTALGGYVDHVTGRVAGTLIGPAGALGEAWYRYRTADAAGEQAAGALFGLDLGREQVDRGRAFVRGVVERAGEDGLAKLWSSARNLPTPAEVDAPGLWLERIALPEVDQGGD
jgi:putative hydrolase